MILDLRPGSRWYFHRTKASLPSVKARLAETMVAWQRRWTLHLAKTDSANLLGCSGMRSSFGLVFLTNIRQMQGRRGTSLFVVGRLAGLFAWRSAITKYWLCRWRPRWPLAVPVRLTIESKLPLAAAIVLQREVVTTAANFHGCGWCCSRCRTSSVPSPQQGDRNESTLPYSCTAGRCPPGG